MSGLMVRRVCLDDDQDDDDEDEDDDDGWIDGQMEDDDDDDGWMYGKMTRMVCLQCFVRHFNLIFLSTQIKTKMLRQKQTY